MAPDPVSWFLIETGWKVVDRDGGDVGRVEAVLADEGKDIFDGLAVSTGLLGKARYVASERVGEIVEGCVALDLAAGEVDALDEYDPRP